VTHLPNLPKWPDGDIWNSSWFQLRNIRSNTGSTTGHRRAPHVDAVILGPATCSCDMMRRKQFLDRDRDKLERDNSGTQHLFLMSELNLISAKEASNERHIRWQESECGWLGARKKTLCHHDVSAAPCQLPDIRNQNMSPEGE